MQVAAHKKPKAIYFSFDIYVCILNVCRVNVFWTKGVEQFPYQVVDSAPSLQFNQLAPIRISLFRLVIRRTPDVDALVSAASVEAVLKPEPGTLG